jgi:hypothetical protein
MVKSPQKAKSPKGKPAYLRSQKKRNTRGKESDDDLEEIRKEVFLSACIDKDVDPLKTKLIKKDMKHKEVSLDAASSPKEFPYDKKARTLLLQDVPACYEFVLPEWKRDYEAQRRRVDQSLLSWSQLRDGPEL